MGAYVRRLRRYASSTANVGSVIHCCHHLDAEDQVPGSPTTKWDKVVIIFH